MQVRSQIVVVAARDADEKQIEFQRADKALTTVTDTYDTHEAGSPILAASVTNYPLPMGKVVTGQFLYIEADGEFQLKLDGEGAAHDIKPAAAGSKAKVLLQLNFSAAPQVSNPSDSAEVTLSYLIAGKKS